MTKRTSTQREKQVSRLQTAIDEGRASGISGRMVENIVADERAHRRNK